MRRKSVRPSRAPASLPDLFPLEVSHTEPAGRVFSRELEPAEAMYMLKAHSAAWAWCRAGDAPATFDATGARALVRELAEVTLTRDLWLALVLLAKELAKKRIDPHAVALACLAVGDCAVARGARQTALRWMETAATVVSLNPRFAWLAGRMHRRWDNCREAEYWLRRAVRKAVRLKDRYTQTLALTSLANMHRQTGNYALARESLDRALKWARRFRLAALKGMILHDLASLSSATGRLQDAEKFGALAFRSYEQNHPNIPKLACDLAYGWLTQGFFERALGVYQSLLRHFELPDERLRVLAAMIRCAGAIGKRDLFERYWEEAWALGHDPLALPSLPSALVDMGRGAISAAEWERATSSLDWAMTTAARTGEADMLVAAEAALESVQLHRRMDLQPRHRRENAQSEQLAEELRRKLKDFRPSASGAMPKE